MSTPEQDNKWQYLLAASAPTFAGESSPPFGFITGTMANLRAERRQVEEIERIGWRAVLASLGAMVVAAAVTFSLNLNNVGNDFEPGDRGLVQIQNISVS
jgi:hypothetical protein